MADDFNDKLNAILSNPELMKTISGLADKFASSDRAENEGTDNPPAPDLGNIANIAKSINSDDDNRIRLLNALRPYMNSKRSANMDTAIKILKLTKLTSLL